MSAVTIPFRNVPNLVKVRCHFCTHERPHWQVHQLGDPARPAQRICDYCIEWHHKALDFLGGGEIPGCGVCGKSWEFLRESSKDVEVRMYAVPKDGIYQVVCRDCFGPYVSRRRDFYGGTAFGAQAKL